MYWDSITGSGFGVDLFADVHQVATKSLVRSSSPKLVSTKVFSLSIRVSYEGMSLSKGFSIPLVVRLAWMAASYSWRFFYSSSSKMTAVMLARTAKEYHVDTGGVTVCARTYCSRTLGYPAGLRLVRKHCHLFFSFILPTIRRCLSCGEFSYPSHACSFVSLPVFLIESSTRSSRDVVALVLLRPLLNVLFSFKVYIHLVQ